MLTNTLRVSINVFLYYTWVDYNLLHGLSIKKKKNFEAVSFFVNKLYHMGNINYKGFEKADSQKKEKKEERI